MSGTRKFVVWFLAVGLLAVVAVAVAVKVYVTKERVIAWVVPPMEEELGREVMIGAVAVGFTSFDLIDFSIGGTESDKPLASVGRVRVAWRLMPLLRARLEVAEAVVEAPTFHLIRLADGTLDIDDLINKGDAKEDRSSKDRGAPKHKGEGAPKVHVELVSITDGSMTFEDRMESPTKSYVVDNFDVELTGLANGSEAFFSVAAKLGPLGGAPLELKGVVNPETSDLSANLKVGDFELKALNSYIGEEATFASGSALVNVVLAVRGGEVAPIELDAAVKGMALVKGEEVRKSGDITLAATVVHDPKVIELQSFRLEIDGQVIEANGRVIQTEPPMIELSATAKELFVDRLTALMPGGGQDEDSKSAPKGAAEGQDKASAKVSVEADIDIDVGHLEASGLAFDQVALEITLKKGVLSVKPLSSNFYKGKIVLNSRVELEREGPPLTVGVKVDGVQIEKLLPALAPSLKDTITGELAAKLDASSSGSGVKGVVAKLGGVVADGKISSSPHLEQLAVLFNSDILREINFYSLSWDVKVKEGIATVESLRLDGRELAVTGEGTVGLEDQRLDLSIVASVPTDIGAKLIHDRNILQALTDKEGRVGVPLRLTGDASAPSYSLDERKLAKVAGKAAKKAATKEVQKLIEKKAGKLGPVEKVLPGLLDNLFGK